MSRGQQGRQKFIDHKVQCFFSSVNDFMQARVHVLPMSTMSCDSLFFVGGSKNWSWGVCLFFFMSV